MSALLWSVNISNKKWYVVQIKSNSYDRAISNLHQQGFETFLPLLETTKRKSTRFFNNLLPLFPGYMFVTFDPYKAHWYKINSTFGVSKLLNFNGKPKEIPIDFILALRKRCDINGKLLLPNRLKKGDNIEILTGPFSNFIAKIENVDEEKRIWAFMTFMGQLRRFQLKPDELMLLSFN